MTPSRPIVPELRSIPLTYLDCPDYTGIDEDVGTWCVNSDGDFTMCAYGRANGLCPRHYP